MMPAMKPFTPKGDGDPNDPPPPQNPPVPPGGEDPPKNP